LLRLRRIVEEMLSKESRKDGCADEQPGRFSSETTFRTVSNGFREPIAMEVRTDPGALARDLPAPAGSSRRQSEPKAHFFLGTLPANIARRNSTA
jgi:hypothetical protein